jgi:hypothetical protein
VGVSGTPSDLPIRRSPVRRSTSLWSPERPEVLVVCCSDGRYHAHLEEFVRASEPGAGERPDMIALPGGPAALSCWSSSFDHQRVLEHALALLTGSHPLRTAWLIAHQGCGFYRARHPGAGEVELEARQRGDLALARRALRERCPGLDVRCVLARVSGEEVEFEELSEREG